MPTHSIAGALLVLSVDIHEDPWTWSVWQHRTGLSSSPISKTGDHPDDWTPAIIDSVNTFADNFRALPDDKRIAYTRNHDDHNAVGRKAWHKFVLHEWNNGWNGNKTIDEILTQNKADPYEVTRRFKATQLPDLATSQVNKFYDAIADALFGNDAFHDDFTKEPVRKFLDSVMVNYWSSYRTRISRERSRLEKHLKEIGKIWKDIGNSKEHATPSMIRTWLRKIESSALILSKYNDEKSLNELDKYRQTLGDMLDAAGSDGDGRDKSRLPKILRRAIEHLASENQVAHITALLHGQLVGMDPEAPADPVYDFDLDSDPLNVEWGEGVSEFKGKSIDELHEYLGLSKKKMPFFNLRQATDGSRDPWVAADKEWFNDPKNTEPLIPRWHQLVGIVKMVKNAFQGLPILLMDSVGLGKTLQIVGVIAVLAYFREYHGTYGQFPGRFATAKWRGTSDNIPDTPSVIIVPVTLMPQTINELHRFLEHASFDVLPYVGSWSKRQRWWEEVWLQCKNSNGRRIIVTTSRALETDFHLLFNANDRKLTVSTKTRADFTTVAATTIYGYNYLVTAFDEAHAYRNVKKSYWMAFKLREQSQLPIAMTATPVTTHPMDLWNMGRWLGLEKFGHDFDEEANRMQRELRAATRYDRKEQKQSKNAKKIALDTIQGGGNGVVTSRYKEEMPRWMDNIRVRYSGVVIARTVHSVDNMGASISGLDPFKECLLVIKLYPHEMENLDRIAAQMVEDDAHLGAANGRFYLPVRRALLHPSCNPDREWTNPTALDEWHKDPSRKLDILAQVAMYHLDEDGRPSLTIVNDKLVPTPDKGPTSAKENLPRDKIVIYSYFPSSNEQLVKVLDLYGIKTLQLNGGMTLSARAQTIERFRNGGTNDPRVLVLSNVGTIGLNLPCANILIIVDAFWSAQDDGQLIGRVWRPPQPKPVFVYRIIAENTPDVFLNAISFGKAAIHQAFTGSSESMRTLFSQNPTVNDSDADAEATDGPEGKTRPKPRVKTSRVSSAATSTVSSVATYMAPSTTTSMVSATIASMAPSAATSTTSSAVASTASSDATSTASSAMTSMAASAVTSTVSSATTSMASTSTVSSTMTSTASTTAISAPTSATISTPSSARTTAIFAPSSAAVSASTPVIPASPIAGVPSVTLAAPAPSVQDQAQSATDPLMPKRPGSPLSETSEKRVRPVTSPRTAQMLDLKERLEQKGFSLEDILSSCGQSKLSPPASLPKFQR